MQDEHAKTPAGSAPDVDQNKPTDPAAERRTERNARIAVTVFPLLVIGGGLIGFFGSDPISALGPTIPWGLGVIMFFMGVTLTLPDFTRIAKRPWVVLLGTGSQFIVMPLAGWLIAQMLSLPPALAIGVILVGCAPGGTASNVVTYLAKGDVALSVSITTVSTLLAPLLTPVLTLWLAGSYMDVSAGSMMVSIVQTVLLPVIGGVIVRALFSRIIDLLGPILPWLSTVAIAYVVAVVVAGSAGSLLQAGALVLVAVILHNGVGLALGYLAARVAGLDAPARRALSFEVGLQNSGLASSLAQTHFPAEPTAALPGAVFSVWHNVSGAILAAFFARRPLKD